MAAQSVRWSLLRALVFSLVVKCCLPDTVPVNSAAAPGRELVLCSHGRVMLFDTSSGESRVLHEGRGVYYGTFPGEDGTLWVVSRSHNDRPLATTQQGEYLLQINMSTGQLVDEKEVPTRFAHDTVRFGNHVYLADTYKGRVVQLSYPSMKVERITEAFTFKDHVNTLAVFPAGTVPGEDAWTASGHDKSNPKVQQLLKLQETEQEAYRQTLAETDASSFRGKGKGRESSAASEDNKEVQRLEREKAAERQLWISDGKVAESLVTEELWAVLHRKGNSRLVRVDLATGNWTRALTEIGKKSHGCVLWRDKFLLLSSGEGTLISVDPLAPNEPPSILWADPQRTFLKGLAVVENVAYFGISKFGSREERSSKDKTSEVGAFHLIEKRLLWRRTVQTAGLLNVVAAPHLSMTSTYLPVESWSGTDPAAERKEL
eukprot:TRINITY_DN34235_c0_g1_i2.p1 TRINITY_DN34235_c0_g1~~TRINITY_DN34235_c0_g1_i2.p1  ORF type:complete len:431 (-),score=75.61 TRINITY_DN34235_c0_g1_i2:79-1371(-)